MSKLNQGTEVTADCFTKAFAEDNKRLDNKEAEIKRKNTSFTQLGDKERSVLLRSLAVEAAMRQTG